MLLYSVNLRMVEPDNLKIDEIAFSVSESNIHLKHCATYDKNSESSIYLNDDSNLISSYEDSSNIIPNFTQCDVPVLSLNTSVNLEDSHTDAAVNNVSSPDSTKAAKSLPIFQRVSAYISTETMNILANNLPGILNQIKDIHINFSSEIYEISGSLMAIISVFQEIKKMLIQLDMNYSFIDDIDGKSVDDDNLHNSNRKRVGRPKGSKKVKTSININVDGISTVTPMQTRSKKKQEDETICNEFFTKTGDELATDVENEANREAISIESVNLIEPCYASLESQSNEENHNHESDIADDSSVSSDNACEIQSPISNSCDMSDPIELAYKYSCDLCSFKSDRKTHFEKHFKIHGIKKTISCSQCEFSTISANHLKRHQRLHSTLVHRCHICSYFTHEKRLLLKHHAYKHRSGSSSYLKSSCLTDKLLSCKICSYKTRRPKLYSRHLKKHQIVTDDGPLLSFYECKECQYRTRRKEHYNRHVRSVHSEDRPYLCDLCGKTFKRSETMRQHMECVHKTFGSSIPNANKDDHFKCDRCPRYFRTRSHLKEHLNVHSDDRSVLCDICGVSFKSRSNLKKHVKNIHNNPQSHSCNFCNKRFSTGYALKRHVKNVHNVNTLNDKSNELHPEEQIISDQAETYVMTMNDNKITQLINETVTTSLTGDTLATAAQNCDQTAETAAIINVASLNDIIVAPGSAVMTEQISQVSNENPTAITLQESIDVGAQSQPNTFIQTSEATTALLYLTTNFS